MEIQFVVRKYFPLWLERDDADKNIITTTFPHNHRMCGPRDAVRRQLGKSETLSVDATTRTILSNEKGQFCAEPPPDASTNYFSQLELGAKLGVQDKVTAEANANSVVNSDLVKLFQRITLLGFATETTVASLQYVNADDVRRKVRHSISLRNRS